MRIVITANGEGSRMKCLSPLPKHHLFVKDKRVIDILKDSLQKTFGIEPEVLTGKPSNSRKETLQYIADYTDTLIVDCDIIFDELHIKEFKEDTIFYLESDKQKYSSLLIKDGKVLQASESENISPYKSAGVYFVKSVQEVISKMGNTNSIAEAMTGALAVRADYIQSVGDPEDYYETLKIRDESFTGNKITFNENTVIKHCSTGNKEYSWFERAHEHGLTIPMVPFADDEMIITERIYPSAIVTANDVIKILQTLRQINVVGSISKQMYFNNIDIPEDFTGWLNIIDLPDHMATFYHGDLSTKNIIKNTRTYLIDPNYKGVGMGSWLTDAAKAIFSFIAYEKNLGEAMKIADYTGKDVWPYVICEGLRVVKYKPEYISIVNNIHNFVKDFK